MSESANDGLPVFVPGRVVRVPLMDLHEFLVTNGLEIPGCLLTPGGQYRLVVELAPVETVSSGQGTVVRGQGTGDSLTSE